MPISIGQICEALKWRRTLAANLVGAVVTPRQWASDAPPDFLVVGLQKCGSFWVTALLDAHPEVTSIAAFPHGLKGPTEGHFFDALAARDGNPQKFGKYFNRAHQGLFMDIIRRETGLPWPEVEKRLARRYFAFLQRNKAPGSRLVGDKTTEYVFHLDLIDRLCPGVSKICVCRNVADRIVSFHYHQIRKKRWSHEAIEDWEIESYLERVQREYRCLLDYPGPIHLVAYEELSSNPVEAVMGMYRHLGVSHDEDTTRRAVERASFSSLSGGRSRGQGDVSSHFRKGLVGEGKKELSPGQLEMLEARLAPLDHALFEKYQKSFQRISG